MVVAVWGHQEFWGEWLGDSAGVFARYLAQVVYAIAVLRLGLQGSGWCRNLYWCDFVRWFEQWVCRLG